MIAHAVLYEQLARNYVAVLVGGGEWNITRYGYRLPNGETLGTRKGDGYRMQVGTIQGGEPLLTYPRPVE